MIMVTVDILLRVAFQIYIASLKGENTSKRVGGLLRDIINFFEQTKLKSGGYLGTAQDLYNIISSVEGGYNGIASIDIVNPIVRGYYISLTGGVFPNFGNIVVPEGYSILYFEDGHWAYQNITLNPNDPILDTDFFD